MLPKRQVSLLGSSPSASSKIPMSSTGTVVSESAHKQIQPVGSARTKGDERDDDEEEEEEFTK